MLSVSSGDGSMPPSNKLQRIRKGILGWYGANRRPFPWRETRDPYRILLSEIMLQQTQADRVSVLYPKFLSKYPTVEELCDTSRAEVVRAWKGLGYNNRAVRLHAAVREIRTGYNCRVPDDIDDLDSLPGVGKYTACAVACFAFGRKTPLVDVNVRRVLSRIFRKMTGRYEVLDDATVWKMAGRILPRDAYTWNQALMEFGTLVCTARNPACGECPVRTSCPSLATLRSSPAGKKSRTAGPVPQRERGRASATQRGRGRRPAGEPAHFGVPRRIWRGRVVEHLRGTGRSVTLGRLARALRPDGRNGSNRWLDDVVEGLERDGVVQIRRGGSRTSVALAP